MNLEEREDLVWRLQRWHGLIGLFENPEMAIDEIGDYLDYLQGHTRRRPPIKNEGVHVTKKDENKKQDDADIKAAKDRFEKMKEEVREADKRIREDPGR
jgi:hypothetical protein